MKVTILTPVRHDGTPMQVGDVVDLDKKAAQALIDCGAAEEGGSAKRAKPKADADPEASAADQAGKGQGSDSEQV